MRLNYSLLVENHRSRHRLYPFTPSMLAQVSVTSTQQNHAVQLNQLYIRNILTQHKVVEEQLHLAATMRTAQMLREPPHRAALDIASRGVVLYITLGAGAVKSLVQNSQHTRSNPKSYTRTQGSIYLIGSGYIVWLHS
jgi:hypothetical protein